MYGACQIQHVRIWHGVHTSARVPCRQILVAEPSERITMAEIQRHPWFVRDLPEGVAQMNSALLAQQQAAGAQ